MGVYLWKERHRQPSSNTILYVPMVDTITEESWNSTITNYSVTPVTIAWVKCWYFNGSARIESDVSAFTNVNHTLSAWVRWAGTSTWQIISSNPCGVYKWDLLGISDSWTSVSYTVYYNSNQSWNINKSNEVMSERHHVCFSGGILYLDGVNVGSNSWGYTWGTVYTIGGHTTWSNCTRVYFTGYIGRAIIESVVWSADEVLDYFNYTKSIYWLS